MPPKNTFSSKKAKKVTTEEPVTRVESIDSEFEVSTDSSRELSNKTTTGMDSQKGKAAEKEKGKKVVP